MITAIEKELRRRERAFLAAGACLSEQGVRRRSEELPSYRPAFSVDADRILHAKAYTRYIDKTQVFYMVENDHITHRVLHVQLVSKIGRTIGRFLGLNEDLIEAIALGHDIGHPPFGHDGETFLSRICQRHGLPPFLHNLQSVRFLEHIEKQGRGLNLTLQTLDGIMCHDGEVDLMRLRPERGKDFNEFDRQRRAKEQNPKHPLTPMTLEGCVVRLSDTIAYVGRDIEDAIELELISRDDLPPRPAALLGRTNGTIVYHLVTDLIQHSHSRDAVGFGEETAAALLELKKFNYEQIYLNPALKKDLHLIEACYEAMFDRYLDCVRHGRGDGVRREFIEHLEGSHLRATAPEVIVRDFIAGMTDDYFLSQAALLGCRLPTSSTKTT